MTTTGWTGEDAERPAMPASQMVLSMKQRGPGDTLEIALARSRAAEAREIAEANARVRDPDEYAANLIARGVMPGQMLDLGRRLADTEAELETERALIAKGERTAERVRGMLERGQIGGLEAARLMDGEFGDAHRAGQLERRARSLREQIAEASAQIPTREDRAETDVEEAASRARKILAQVTGQRAAEDARDARGRAQIEAQRSAFYEARGRRPFVSRSVEAEPPPCEDCVAVGASAEESLAIHEAAGS